jgi:hypothetical protein
MAKWTDMGHAMRRRVGAPSSHLEAAGADKARDHYTSEEHYEMAKNAKSPRVSLGEGAIDTPHEVMSPKQNAPLKGKLVAKKSGKSQDPTGYGKGAARSNVLYNERLGASYRVSVKLTPTADPVAGPTMASAKIVPSVLGRQAPDFKSAVSEQY